MHELMVFMSASAVAPAPVMGNSAQSHVNACVQYIPLTKSDGSCLQGSESEADKHKLSQVDLGNHLPPMQTTRQSPSTKPGSDVALEAANFNHTCRQPTTWMHLLV